MSTLSAWDAYRYNMVPLHDDITRLHSIGVTKCAVQDTSKIATDVRECDESLFPKFNINIDINRLSNRILSQGCPDLTLLD